MHQTSRQGVLIMDTAALIQSQRFNLTLTPRAPTSSTRSTATDRHHRSERHNYWPYELSGNTVSTDRTVTINATPANDVAMMVVSTKIRSIGVWFAAPFLIHAAGPLSTAISVDSSASATDVQLALLRDNGLSVGRRTVYINTINNVTVSTYFFHQRRQRYRTLQRRRPVLHRRHPAAAPSIQTTRPL